MPGAELKTSVRGGCVVAALRGDLDVTGAAQARGGDHGPGGAGSEPGRAPEAVPLAAACGAYCTPWEGSAIAYWYRVIAAGAAASLAGSMRGRMRR